MSTATAHAAVDYAAIPDELKNLPQWVLWKYEDRDGRITKPPFSASTGQYAKTSDRTTWTTLESAQFAAEMDADTWSGVGFVFSHSPENPIIGIDFDGVIRDGSIDAYTAALLRALNSYTEISPSGNGLHVYIKSAAKLDAGKKFTDKKQAKHANEIYSDGRFFTVTGNRFGDATTLSTVNEEKLKFIQFLLSKIADEKFKQLWTGTFSKDDSAMDLALCNYLARNYSSDPAKIDAAFRLSNLVRPKWDSNRGATTYGAITIAKAVASLVPQVDALDIADTIGTDEESEIESEIIEEPLPEFPQVPGLLTEMSEALCPDIPREFKIMAAVTRIGLILSGKTALKNQDHLQPRFYTCLMAPPGCGKTAAINETEKLFANARYLSTTSVDSGPALIDTFEEATKTMGQLAKVMLAPDELSDLFEKSKSSKDGKNSLSGEFLKLFEGTKTGNRTRAHGAHDLTNAHLSILGGVPTDKYAEMWTGTHGSGSGLQSRITLVTTTAKPMPIRVAPTDTEKLSQVMEKIRQRVAKAPAVISWDDDAISALVSWWESKPRTGIAERRVNDIVKRFLIVLAVLAGTASITLGLVQTGIAFGDYQIAMRERFNVADASSFVQTSENRIQTAYKKHGAMTDNALRRYVNPAALKGGFGPYLQALNNLRKAGAIVLCGKTQRAEKWGLPNQRLQTG
jgi:hypothetical protein